MSTALTRRLGGAVLAVLLAFGMTLLHPARANAAGVGYIRLAHLVPDNIKCDMYIQLDSGNGKVLKKLASIAYGTVSDYETVPAGTYAVTMRKPGDPESALPVLTASITVEAGKAYTAARIGPPDKAEARVFPDDRSLPAGNVAKLRVVQVAQRTVDVSVVNGPSVASGAGLATITAYTEVQPGKRELKVQPAGGQPITVPAAFDAGGVYSVLVLEGIDGKLSALLRTDAKRAGQMPNGGVDTGAGGTAHEDYTPLLVGGAVLVALMAAAVLVRRRWRTA